MVFYEKEKYHKFLLLVQSNLAIRNFLVALKLFINAKSSLSLWSKWQIDHRKWFLNTNLFLIKPFLIAKFDCSFLENLQRKYLTISSSNNRLKFTFYTTKFYPFRLFTTLPWKQCSSTVPHWNIYTAIPAPIWLTSIWPPQSVPLHLVSGLNRS